MCVVGGGTLEPEREAGAGGRMHLMQCKGNGAQELSILSESEAQ